MIPEWWPDLDSALAQRGIKERDRVYIRSAIAFRWSALEAEVRQKAAEDWDCPNIDAQGHCHLYSRACRPAAVPRTPEQPEEGQ